MTYCLFWVYLPIKIQIALFIKLFAVGIMRESAHRTLKLVCRYKGGIRSKSTEGGVLHFLLVVTL